MRCQCREIAQWRIVNNPRPNKIASAYKFSDRLVLHSFGQTPAGFYVACEPYLILPRDATAQDLGHAVQAAVARFCAEILQPTDWKQTTAAYVRGVGARSHRKLQETSVCCGIAECRDRIEFEPSHNGGTSGDTKGFQPIPDAKISISANSTPIEIGTALFEGFARCTTIYEQF